MIHHNFKITKLKSNIARLWPLWEG